MFIPGVNGDFDILTEMSRKTEPIIVPPSRAVHQVTNVVTNVSIAFGYSCCHHRLFV